MTKTENLKYLLSLALDELYYLANCGILCDDEVDKVFDLIEKIERSRK